MEYRLDCQYFLGDKPCKFLERCTCQHFSLRGPRILVIKLGALGDVLRTTPILPALRNANPTAQISWVTHTNALELLTNNTFVDRLLSLDSYSWGFLCAEEFDLVLNLDKDPAAAALASLAKAKTKRGFGWSAQGAVYPLDEKSHYAYFLGIDNELKFKTNQKTYQQIIFEMCDLPYAGEEYQWELSPTDAQTAKLWAKGTGLDRRRPTVALNTGWGEMFAGKGWKEESWESLINSLQGFDVNIVLLGGSREADLNTRLFHRNRGRGSLHNSGTNNTLGQFSGLVDLCDLVVSGDTLGMHVAIARKKKVVALFGSTCPQEIELYGRGVKLFPTDLPCSPCYKKQCDHAVHEECLKRISVEQVMNSIQGLLSLQPLRKEQREQQTAGMARQKDMERQEQQTARPVDAYEQDNEKPFSVSAQVTGERFSRPQSSNRHEGRRERGGRWRRFRGRGPSHSQDSSGRPHSGPA